MLDAYRGITWTPDGQSLLVGTVGPDAPQLWLVPINGGSPRKLDIDVTTWITTRGIRLDPRGNQIAFFSGKGGSEVWALENVVPVAK
jgi:Tol biopolymer transport system component